MRLLAALLMALFVGMSGPVPAVQPDEMLADPVLEARARDISADLRCLVCQNQSIDDSDADLARDLRLIVRERLVAGDTDDAVMRYIVDRYGEFVLLRPVMGWHTLLLWIAAPVLLVIGLLSVFLAARRRRDPVVSAISPQEAEALAALERQAQER